MDITKLLFEYNDLRRHLWNQYFAPKIDGISDPCVDIFLEIQKLLFQSLVLIQCGRGEHDLGAFGTDPIEFILVRLSDDLGQIELLEANNVHPTQWEKRLVKRSDWIQVRLEFVDFFDWYPQDPEGRCSFSQVEVRVRTTDPSTSRPSRWVIPVEHVTFVFEHVRQ